MKILVLPAYYYPEQAASPYLGDNIREAMCNAGFILDLYAPMPTRGVSEEIRLPDRVLGPFCRGAQGYVHQPRADGDRQKVRQDRRPDRPAVPAPERCGHHPQVCSQGAHAPELRPV